MSKTGLAVAALFLGLALFQGTKGFFADDSTLPPPSTDAPSPLPEVSPSKTPQLKPFPSFEGQPPDARGFGSTNDLVAVLKKRGIDCSNLGFLDQPDPDLTEFSLCDPGAPERRFNIYFYEQPKDRAVWLTSMRVQKLPLPLVWGPNWIIVAAGEPTTAHERIKSIQGAIGGTIEDFSPKKKKG